MTDPTADPSTTPGPEPDPAQPPEAPQPPDPAPPPEPTPHIEWRDPKADPTPPRRPRPTGPVQYRGDDLTPDRGPGLGCFWTQLIVLVFFIILTPLSVVWNWPFAVSAGLLFAVIGLLLVTGQTIIFLLRLVAADRRGRRRPLASGSKTVGEIEDASATEPGDEPTPPDDGTPPEGPVRQ